MPYILVRGNLAAYGQRYPWRVLVSGLKAGDIEQLNRFASGGYCDDCTIVYMQHPCAILTALEVLGYKVVASSSTSVKQDYNEYMWTMRKEFSEPEPIVSPTTDTHVRDNKISSGEEEVLLMSSGTFAYVAVKASIHASDSAVFGLSEDEEKALVKKFSDYRKEVINGVLLKATPIEVVNALGQLGYRVVATTAVQSLDELEFERGVWYAAQYGDLDRVKKLLSSARSDPDQRDAAGYTALHYAARNGHLDVCKILIEKGADVNSVTRVGKATALCRASSAGKKDVVEYLLSRKADPFIQDSDGKTALHRAAESKHFLICQILINAAPSLQEIADNKGNRVDLTSNS